MKESTCNFSAIFLVFFAVILTSWAKSFPFAGFKGKELIKSHTTESCGSFYISNDGSEENILRKYTVDIIGSNFLSFVDNYYDWQILKADIRPGYVFRICSLQSNSHAKCQELHSGSSLESLSIDIDRYTLSASCHSIRETAVTRSCPTISPSLGDNECARFYYHKFCDGNLGHITVLENNAPSEYDVVIESVALRPYCRLNIMFWDYSGHEHRIFIDHDEYHKQDKFESALEVYPKRLRLQCVCD